MIAKNMLIFLILFFLTVILAIYGDLKFNFDNMYIFILASFCAVFVAFGIGSNDAANSFGTSVGSKALSIKQALFVCAVFELSGVLFASNDVVETIRDKIVAFPDLISPILFVCIMLSALFSSGVWIFFATKKGLPISATHSIIGSIIGASFAMSIVEFDFVQFLHIVKWEQIGQIAISWIVSPFLGLLIAYFLYTFIDQKIIKPIEKKEKIFKKLKEKKLIAQSEYWLNSNSRVDDLLELEKEQPTQNSAKINLDHIREKKKSINIKKNLRLIPYVVCIGIALSLSIFLFEGVGHNDFYHILIDLWIILVAITVIYFIITSYLAISSKTKITKTVKKVFIMLQVVSACCFAFSHGSNDIANALAPFLAILDVLNDGDIDTGFNPSFFLFVVLGLALVFGFIFLGKEVIDTVGNKITFINPISGFCIELSASIVILSATQIGLPISSTHVLIGSILGIGIYAKNANWKILKIVVFAWIVTLPVTALISSIVFIVFKAILLGGGGVIL